MRTITFMARRAGLGVAAVLLVLTANPAAQEKKEFDPSGPWQGPCVGKDRADRTLKVSFTRAEKVWRAKGDLATPGYPGAEREFDEVKVTGDTVAFLGLWGPMVAEFSGVHKAGKIEGNVKLVREQQTVMSCAWSLSRAAAK